MELWSARLGERPLYTLLVQFPVVCFVGALATDIAYWRTELFSAPGAAAQRNAPVHVNETKDRH